MIEQTAEVQIDETGDTGGAAAPSPIGEAAPQGEPAASDWRDSISGDLRDRLDVESLEDLAKGYVNAQQMIGSSIRIPGKDAGEADWNKFYDRFKDIPGLTRYNPEDLSSLYEAAGKPADVRGYGQEGVSEEFLQTALEAGLNRQQVEKLLEFQDAQDIADQKKADDEFNTGLDTLKKEWGLAFDRKIAEGQRAVSFLEKMTPGIADALDSTGAGNHPAMVRLFQQLGANLSESGNTFAASSAASGGLTPYEARQQISEIQNNPQHPYHSGDESAIEKFLELHRYAHPD